MIIPSQHAKAIGLAAGNVQLHTVHRAQKGVDVTQVTYDRDHVSECTGGIGPVQLECIGGARPSHGEVLYRAGF